MYVCEYMCVFVSICMCVYGQVMHAFVVGNASLSFTSKLLQVKQNAHKKIFSIVLQCHRHAHTHTHTHTYTHIHTRAHTRTKQNEATPGHAPGCQCGQLVCVEAAARSGSSGYCSFTASVLWLRATSTAGAAYTSAPGHGAGMTTATAGSR